MRTFCISMIVAAMIAANPAWLPAQTPPRTGTQTAAAAGVPFDVRVTDRSGAAIAGAMVRMEGGPSSRDGSTNAQGLVTFQSVRAGTYRLRLEREGFTTLEKEVVIRTTRITADAALTPAPAPPAPLPAPPPVPIVVPEAPKLTPGAVEIVSVPTLAEKLLKGSEPSTESAIGCSGATLTRLFVLRQPLAGHSHDDADETIYVVAGEGTISVGDRRENIAAGSLSVVPRTIAHTVTPRGRNPVILVSTISGPPCKNTGTGK
jgi:mannose-6-phosphate isomerase-like protein (cupin superfamily)